MSNLPYKIVNFVQGESDWLQWRRSKITASNAAAIMGLDPYTTPLMLYNRILSGEEVPDNHFMKHGRETEAEARGWLAMQTGKAYIPVCMESVQYPWMGCSLDGWREHYDPAACEIKCPMKTIEQFAMLDEIPVPHFAQMQHQMCVAGIDKMYYVTYSKQSQEGLILTIKRDDLFIKKLLEAEKAFWDRLGSFEPPDPIDGRDYVEISDLKACEVARRLREVKAERKELEKEEDALEAELKEIIGNQSALIGKEYSDVNCRMTKYFRKGNVDTKRIAEEYSIDLEKYRKPPTTNWRFS